MRITELAEEITVGKKIPNSELTSAPTNYLYVQSGNIERGIAISEAHAKYVLEKAYRKFSPKPVDIGYGDFLIFRIKDAPNYSILRLTQTFKKKLIPSENVLIIKNPQSFLTTFLQHETGRLYFQNEIDDINSRSNGNFVEIVKHFKQIDIDPIILENVNLTTYSSPGNTKISPEDLKKINVRSDVITIDNIHKRLEESEIRLDGYFQRKSNLWPDDIKSRLIETIILNMPIPPLFFDVTNDEKWLIVDGLQRISAINSFYNDELKLTNLDYLPELEGKKFSDLDRSYTRKFEEKQLSYFAIYPGTPKSVRYKIFKNINVSALILNRQEIRHAINEDEDAEFTSSKYILSLTPIINKYVIIAEKGANGRERMADSELCLRYIAFKVLNYKHDYNGSVQDFLDKAMERIYAVQRNKLNVFKEDFESTLDVIARIFKETAYTKAMVQKDGAKSFNGNLFAVWTYLISRLTDTEMRLLEKRKVTFRERALELSSDASYEKAIDSRYFESVESLKIQIELTDKLIKSILND